MTELLEAVKGARRVYIIGNGGSYANASHICNDLLSCRIKDYTMDSASLSAFANDYGWEHAFAHWLAIVGEPGDLLLAMSGSGTSKNILNAVDAARSIGMDVYCLFGNERKETMQEAEESQIILGHGLHACLQLAN